MIRKPLLIAVTFTSIALGAFAFPASPAAAQRGCLVRVFEHDGFDGASFRSGRDVAWVGDRWNDRISSLVVEAGVWEFYEHINYGGRSFRLSPGEHPSVGPAWNDRISSFRCLGGDRRAEPGDGVPAGRGRGCAVRVFEHDGFDGASFEARRDLPWVGDRWNDRVSSIVVRAGVWEFYEHVNYEGRSFRLGPGERPSVGPAWNDRISSFRCVG